MARKRLLAGAEPRSLPESSSGGHKRQDLTAQAKVSSEVIWCLFGVCSLNDPYRIARPIETKETPHMYLNRRYLWSNIHQSKNLRITEASNPTLTARIK